MRVEKFPLEPPSLDELADKLNAPLAANYEQYSVNVVECPDLRLPPFHLSAPGLCGGERISDVGGGANLWPWPRLDSHWSMIDIAKAMEMSSSEGLLIGAGAGPFHVIGQNTELAPDLSWHNTMDTIQNNTRFVKVDKESGAVVAKPSPSVDCGLMMNLFGSQGNTGPVLRITARGRKGAEASFSECIRKGIHAAYGDERTVSLGGTFIVKSGKAKYHIMPDFPSEEDLPFKDRDAVERWLTYEDLAAPMVCLSVMHSADPGGRMGLRLEHTHCFSPTRADAGGHYHFDVDRQGEVVEYEAYFNTASTVYRLDRPIVDT